MVLNQNLGGRTELKITYDVWVNHFLALKGSIDNKVSVVCNNGSS